MPGTFIFFKNVFVLEGLVKMCVQNIFTAAFWLKGIQMLVFDVVTNCLMIAENGCIRGLLCFSVQLKALRYVSLDTHTGTTDYQIL